MQNTSITTVLLYGRAENILIVIVTCALSSPQPHAVGCGRYMHGGGVSRSCTVVIDTDRNRFTPQLTALAIGNNSTHAGGVHATNRWFKLTVFTSPALLSHHTPKMPQN